MCFTLIHDAVQGWWGAEGTGEPGLPFPVARWTLAAPAGHWAGPVRGVGSTGCAHRGPRKLKGLGSSRHPLELVTWLCARALRESGWVLEMQSWSFVSPWFELCPFQCQLLCCLG